MASEEKSLGVCGVLERNRPEGYEEAETQLEEGADTSSEHFS